MEKTNIQHAIAILQELEASEHGTDPFNQKIREVEEFLEAAADEISGLKEDLKETESEKKELTQKYDHDIDAPCMDYQNEDFVGLDTINWSLDKGNLAIQSKMELFINQLKKENLCTIS